MFDDLKPDNPYKIRDEPGTVLPVMSDTAEKIIGHLPYLKKLYEYISANLILIFINHFFQIQFNVQLSCIE